MFLQIFNLTNQIVLMETKHVQFMSLIRTERRMSKLVLNIKYLLLLSFLTAAEFYNLGHIQGIMRVP